MKNGFWSKTLFASRIKSEKVRLGEVLFGYWLSPTLALLASGLFTSGFLNIYFTQYLFVELLAEGGTWQTAVNVFLAVLPMASCVPIVLGNLFVGQLIQHTYTSCGKSRPWILASGLVMPLAVVSIFAIPLVSDPASNPVLTMVLTALAYNLFFAVAYPLYYTANSSLVPVSTRNGKQRGVLASVSNMALSTGIGIGGMLFPYIRKWLIPDTATLFEQRLSWFWIFLVIGAMCFVALVVQFYCTRERVNEEIAGLPTEFVVKPTVHQQFSAVGHDGFWWMSIIFCALFQFGCTMRNLSLPYYVNIFHGDFVEKLGGSGSMQSLYTFVGSIPMTIAALLVVPLSMKVGKRPLVIVGLLIDVVGSTLCFLQGDNVVGVCVGVALKNLGAAPGSYLMLAMLADALDHNEARNGFRCDGLTMSIYASVMIVSQPLAQGLFNALSAAGINQTMSNFCYIWVEGILYALLAVMMLFFTVERHLEDDRKKVLSAEHAALSASNGDISQGEVAAGSQSDAADDIATVEECDNAASEPTKTDENGNS